MQAPWWWSKTETCRSDMYVYFNVNFYVFYKLIKVHLLVTELYIYQNSQCNNKKMSKIHVSWSSWVTQHKTSRNVVCIGPTQNWPVTIFQPLFVPDNFYQHPVFFFATVCTFPLGLPSRLLNWHSTVTLRSKSSRSVKSTILVRSRSSFTI